VPISHAQSPTPLTDCGVISAPGTFNLTNDLNGAPNSVSTPVSATACVKITASDVVFDCDGHSITNNGTAGTTYGILLDGPISNVTVQNCYGISGYSYAADAYESNSSLFTNDTASDSDYGFYLQSSNNDDLTGNTANGNSQYGVYLQKSNNTWITGDHYFNNSLADFYITAASALALNLTGVVFDNPAGGMANFTNLSLSDQLRDGETYTIKWAPSPAAPPNDYESFAQKFVSISNLSGTVSIKSINWSWTDAESAGHDADGFELWDYHGGTWTNASAALNTMANTLSLTNLNPVGTYGILERLPTCPVIASSTIFNMTNDFAGAPNDASFMPDGGMACVEISASNVVFDCDGHSITNNGMTGTTYAILLDGPLTNVTVQNCPGISGYTYGLYAYQSDNDTFTNGATFNNSVGIFLDSAQGNDFSGWNASGNSIWGFSSTSGSTDNIVDNLSLGDNIMSFDSKDVNVRESGMPQNISGPPSVEIDVLSAESYGTKVTGISEGQAGPNDVTSFGPTTVGYVGSVAYYPEANGSVLSTDVPTDITPLSDINLTGSMYGDESVSDDIQLPFNVTLFGRENDHIRIGLNGFIYMNNQTVVSDESACCEEDYMSSQDITQGSDYLVAGLWADLVTDGVNSNVYYGVAGTAPNRVYVIYYDNASEYGSGLTSGNDTFEIKLFENGTGDSNASVAPDPSGFYGIDRFVESTANSPDSYLFLNLSYLPSDVVSVDPSTLFMARYDTNGWDTTPSDFSYPYGVDTSDRYVFANITGFGSVFGILGSQPPPAIAFSPPTPDSGITTSNLTMPINISINETTFPLGQFTYDWNGTNYTPYDSSLVLMYNFDNVSALGENGTQVADVSEYGNNATCTPGSCPTWTPDGAYGGAYSFDGMNDYFTVPNAPSITDQITIAAWVMPLSFPSNGEIVKNNDAYILRLSGDGSGKVEVLLWTNSSFEYNDGHVKLNLGQWNYVVLTYDGSYVNTYVNGVLDLNDSISGTISPANNLFIGADGQYDSEYFNGSIDEVRLYSRALSPSEVEGLYESNLNEYAPGQWQFYIDQAPRPSPSGEYNYAYYGCAQDTSYNMNCTETRNVTFNTTNCGVVTAPGSYDMSNDYVGAPYDASEMPEGGDACIKINSSDVVFDCQGYNVSDAGVGGTTYGIAIDPSLDNVTVRNCQLSGYTYGLWAESDTNSIITNSTASGSASLNAAGFMIDGGSGGNITNATLTGDYYGILLNASSDNLLSDNYLGADYAGVGIQSGSDHNNFTRNTVYGSNWADFDIEDSNNEGIYANNLYTAGAEGINFETSNDDEVSGNSMIGNGNGIYASSLNDGGISGNDIENSHDYGVDFYSSYNNTLSNDSIDNSSYVGIELDMSSQNNLYNDTAMENGQWDLYVDSYPLTGCQDNITDMTGSGYRPIYYSDEPVSLDSLDAAEIELCNASGSNVTDVVVHGSDSFNNDAFMIYYSDDVTISNVSSSYNYEGFDIESSDGGTYLDDAADNDSYSGGFTIENSNALDFTNDSAIGNYDGAFEIDEGSDSSFVNNTAGDSLVGDGFEGYGISQTVFSGNNASGNYQIGFDLSGSGNNFTNNLASGNGQNDPYNGGGFEISNSNGGILLNNTASGNGLPGSSGFGGFYIEWCNGETLLDNNATGNSNAGLYIFNSDQFDSNLTLVQGMYFSNNNPDLLVQSNYQPFTLNLSGLIFDNPFGGMADYTTLSINDTVDPGDEYSVNWTGNPGSIPLGYRSFAQKFVDVSTISGSPSIDSIAWSWNGSELGGYDDTNFGLWQFDGTSWTLLNETPDTIADTLGLTNLSPAGAYAILQTNGTVDLMYPPEGYLTNMTSIDFQFKATGTTPTLNCLLYLDGLLNATNATTENDTPTDFLVSNISTGQHDWYVSCTDGGNNTGTSATRYFNSSTVLPDIAQTSPSNGATYSSSTPVDVVFNFTAADASSPTLNCSLYVDGSIGYNNATFMSGTSNQVVLLMARGAHTWYASCQDIYGNANSSATYGFTISAPAPSPSPQPSYGGGGGGGYIAGPTEEPSLLIAYSIAPCPSNQVTVTTSSSGASLNLLLINPNEGTLASATSGNDDTATFSLTLNGTYEIDGSKQDYQPGTNNFTYVTCAAAAPTNITAPAAPQLNCTSDADCPSTDFCNTTVGVCEPVMSACGFMEGRVWHQYQCCADTDCRQGQFCVANACNVPNITGANEGPSGEGVVLLTVGGLPLANATLQIYGSNGTSARVTTDENGESTLPFQLQGYYTVNVAHGGVSTMLSLDMAGQQASNSTAQSQAQASSPGLASYWWMPVLISVAMVLAFLAYELLTSDKPRKPWHKRQARPGPVQLQNKGPPATPPPQNTPRA
jgi:parallel beta-helix repeat protein